MKKDESPFRLLFLLLICGMCCFGCSAQPIEEPQMGMMNPQLEQAILDPELLNMQQVGERGDPDDQGSPPQENVQGQMPGNPMYGAGGSIQNGGTGIAILIEGIKGTSTIAKHEFWNDVMSYSFHAGQNIEDDRVFGENHLTINKMVDSASPALFQLFKSGNTNQIGQIEMEIMSNGQVIAELVMKNPMVAGYSSSSGSDKFPVETVIFTSSDAEWKIPKFDEKGVLK